MGGGKTCNRVLAGCVAVVLAAARAHAVALAPLIDAPGVTVTLDSGTTYTISEYALSTSKTLDCNGALITSTGGPIRVSGSGVRLTVDHCHIQGTGWALVGALAGAELVVQNQTELAGDGNNTAIYLQDASLDATGGTVDQTRWGVQMENSTAALHGVVVTATIFGVQNVAGDVTLDGGCDFTNLDPVNSGAAVSLIGSHGHPTRAASAVIRNGTFTGFGNAVDIQPTATEGLPSGTVDIADSTFQGAVFSALAAVDATNVRVARTRVMDAKTDGIFLVNSTGSIEDTQVVGSLNSGVSFYGCPDGFLLRRSLVRNSAHQGVAVVVDPVSDRPTHGVRIVDNTLADNAIANLLVDDRSDAVMQGNVFSGAPDMSVRFHGSPSATLVGGLLLDSHGGLELKDGAEGRASLSVFARHARYGALVYANASATFTHCVFDDNGQDPVTTDYALVADTGATLTVGRSAFGPAGNRACFNNAGNAASATYDYWSAAGGPQLPGGTGSGPAVAGANTTNGSTLVVDPVSSSAPVEARIGDDVQLSAGTTTSWTADLGISVTLEGAPGIATVSNGLVAALRAHDTLSLSAPPPPVGTAPDGVVVVWIGFDVLSRVAGGTLRIQAPADSALSRLDDGGAWAPVAATWDAATSELIYAPADPRTLQGIFAFGNGQGCVTARECLQTVLDASLCDPMNPKLQKKIGAKVRAAIARLTKAVSTSKTTKVAKLIAKARKLLQTIDGLAARFASLKANPISPTCRTAIETAMLPALQRLDAGAP